MDDKGRYKEAKKVTLIGAFVNGLLGILKITYGLIGHSSALLADGVHSLSDLLTDMLVVLASRYGSQEADENHPYGHQRIETAATMFLSLLLIVVGIGVVVDGVRHFIHVSTKPHGYEVFAVIVISILANEFLYHYTKRAGERINSKLLIANAWHHRSDAISSLVVLVGVLGTLFGFAHLDSVAACIVGGMIIQMGAKLGWDSINELIDAGVESTTLLKMESLIINCSGVVALHQLRTRSMGGAIFVDVHVLVSEDLSVSEGHHIAQNVANRLREEIQLIDDVTVHVDPEDDEICNPSTHLANRPEIVSYLEAHCKMLKGFDAISRMTLHYIDGEMTLELFFSSKEVDAEAFKLAILKHEQISAVQFYKAIHL
jgi:cation diffusion facilitator family transporter